MSIISMIVHRIAAIGICLLAGCLSACDNTPNPQFAKEFKEASNSADTDPYLPLDNTPQVQTMAYFSETQRQGTARTYVEYFGGTYSEMLAKLDGEKINPTLRPILVLCRAAFSKVVDYGKLVTDPKATVGKLDSSEIEKSLVDCRNRTIAVEKNVDADSKVITNAFRRFTSSGICLLGISMIASGEDAPGRKTWAEGSKLIEKDKAGFKLTLKSLSGY